MAELKEVCSLLGFGQVTKNKKDVAGDNCGKVTQAQDNREVCTSQHHNQEYNIPMSSAQIGAAAPSIASVPLRQQSGTVDVPCEGQDPLTTVTAGNDELLLANAGGEVFKIIQPAVPSPSQGLAYNDNVYCKEVVKEINSFKSRLRSSAVAASKKLEETTAHKRKKKYSHH